MYPGNPNYPGGQPGYPVAGGNGQQGFTWLQSSAHAGIPPNAVYAGNDADGSPIYVGRAFHEGDQLPAKVIPSKQVAYIAYNGQEIAKHHYEVITD